MPTALLIPPENGVPASVTPRWSGYGTLAESIRYARIIVGTWLDLTEILKSRYSSASRAALLECRLDERLRLVSLGQSRQVLWQRARVSADTHRYTCRLRSLDDQFDLLGAADVARVDADGGDAGVDRLERERGVEVDVGDHRQRRELTIFGSASASSVFGTATRTTSQPADASAAICAVSPRRRASSSASSTARRRAHRRRSPRRRREICRSLAILGDCSPLPTSANGQVCAWH